MLGQLNLLKAFDNEDIVNNYDIKSIHLDYSNMFKTHMVILETKCGVRFIKYVRSNGDNFMDSIVTIPSLNDDTRQALIHQFILDGYTQEDIASMIGTSQSNISRYYAEYRRNNYVTKKASMKQIDNIVKSEPSLFEEPMIKNNDDIKYILSKKSYSFKGNKVDIVLYDYIFNDLTNADMYDKYGFRCNTVNLQLTQSDLYYIVQAVYKKLSDFNPISVIHNVLYGEISYNKLSHMMKAYYSDAGKRKNMIKDDIRQIFEEDDYVIIPNRYNHLLSKYNITLSVLASYKKEIKHEHRVLSKYDIDKFIEDRSNELFIVKNASVIL